MNSSKILISVIVPVYNVEAYLVECIESLVAQTFNSYEIILIDDGSTDLSGEICDKYVKLYSFVRVIHQSNYGLSEARNIGIDNALGEYVTFVDSDDYVAKDYLEYLYTNIYQNRADVSIGRMYMFWSEQKYEINDTNCIVTMSPEKALEEMLYRRKFGVTACCKLYKKEVLVRYPKGKLYEDLATTYKIIGAADSIVYGSKAIYFYRQRKASIRHSILNNAQFYAIQAAEEQLFYMKNNYPNLVEAAEFRVALMIFEFISKTANYSKEGKEQFEFLKNKLSIYERSVLKNINVQMSMKVRCIAVKLGYFISCIIFNIIDKLAELKVKIKR